MEKLIHLILLYGLLSIQGYLVTSEENLASKGTVTQSSTRTTWAAKHAIDGVRYGDASTHCSATLSERNPWWRLDLLDIYEIKTVIITARSSCCLYQTNGAEIRIGDSLENNGNNNPICAVTSGLGAYYTVTYSCNGIVGRYVNVVMTEKTTQLSLCEVEVYATENLAFRGTATQSSTYRNWIPHLAIDGRKYGPDVFGDPYCSGTESKAGPWLRLDLLNIYNISRVLITARDYYYGEVSGAEIRVGNSLENNGNNNSRCDVTSYLPGNTQSFSCHGMSGRYVNVIKTGLTAMLILCEVEVFASENLAFRGTATQSSTGWKALNAIDSVRNGDALNYCSSTLSESNPWWRLDLLDYYYISTVIITAHDDYLNEANGAEIRVGNSLENNGNNNPICAVTSDPLAANTISYSCHRMDGRYVNVVMSGRTSHLSLCEVEVYGELLVQKRKTFVRLKFSSSGDVAAESDEILHQLQSVLGSHISDFKLSWTQLPKKEEEQEEEQEEDRGSCDETP